MTELVEGDVDKALLTEDGRFLGARLRDGVHSREYPQPHTWIPWERGIFLEL
jgi:hypothetical protein